MTLDPDTAEWLVLQVHPQGHLVVHSPGGEQKHLIASAQTTGHRYTLAQAQTLAKKLGEPWKVNHVLTLVPPDEHAEWVKHGKRTNWAP